MAEMGKVSLKLLVDPKAKKVIFAEASQNFVEFFFHIFYSLPFGTIVELLTKKSLVGCLADVCKSIKAFNMDKMQLDVTKDSVLNSVVTANTAVNKLPLLMFRDGVSKQFYRCSNVSNNARYPCSCCSEYVTDGEGAVCPNCRKQMARSTAYVATLRLMETATSSCGYMVTDSLEVIPMSSLYGVTIIKELNVKDVASLEEKSDQVGLTEGVELLKAAMETKDVLTTVFSDSIF